MTVLSQSSMRLSIVPIAAAMLAYAAPATAGSAASPYNGRWTVSEDKPVFTARGTLYKTVDIAPCGRDFCGVSVDDAGKCGPVLFRFLGKHAASESLRGHGKWGAEQKNVVIYSYGGDDSGDNAGLELYLGDGANLGSRSGSMPKFHADYRRTGTAKCTAK